MNYAVAIGAQRCKVRVATDISTLAAVFERPLWDRDRIGFYRAAV